LGGALFLPSLNYIGAFFFPFPHNIVALVLDDGLNLLVEPIFELLAQPVGDLFASFDFSRHCTSPSTVPLSGWAMIFAFDASISISPHGFCSRLPSNREAASARAVAPWRGCACGGSWFYLFC
jgi:hypothetical protein